MGWGRKKKRIMENKKYYISISAPNKAELSFPHYIRKIDINTYDIVQRPESQMSVGDLVFNPVNGSKCEIIKKDTLGKAKGDWSAYGFVPIIATITLSQPSS